MFYKIKWLLLTALLAHQANAQGNETAFTVSPVLQSNMVVKQGKPFKYGVQLLMAMQ